MDIQKVAASVFKGFFCKFLKASFSILLVLWLLYRFGMVDAEMGARLVQSGISVYLTPPSADRKFGLIEFVCFSFITLILFCSNLKRSFKSNFQTIRIVTFAFVMFIGGSLFFENVYRSLPCSREARLSVKEFEARYSCKREKYVDRALEMLGVCPHVPAINSSSIEKFLSLPAEIGTEKSSLSRIQVVLFCFLMPKRK